MNEKLLNCFGQYKWQRIFRFVILVLLLVIVVWHVTVLLLSNRFHLSSFLKLLLVFSIFVIFSSILNWLGRITSLNSITGHKQKVSMLLKESFFNNAIQCLWTDILAFSIIMGLILSLLSCEHFDHAMNFENKSTKVFIMWDLAAIFMSLLLTILYLHDILKKGGKGEVILENVNITPLAHAKNYVKMLLSIIVTLGPMGAAGYYLVIEHNYFVMLSMLCVTGLFFLGIDYYLLFNLETSNHANKQKEIDVTIFSLKYANLPAFLGLFLIFVVFCFASFYLQLDYGINAFIAGASAMHMVFGNIVLTAQLGK